jgi:mycothiol system anti-sigma-R factor
VSDGVDDMAPDPCGDGSLSGVNCEEAVHQLYVYLDGELTIERREQISLHLDLCQPCSGAANFEAELRQVIANRCRDRVPDALRQRIADAISAEQERRGRTKQGRR